VRLGHHLVPRVVDQVVAVDHGEPREHVGTESRNYTDAILLPEHEDLRYRIAPLAPGTYYLAMTTLTPDGIESEYSQEMTARLN